MLSRAVATGENSAALKQRLAKVQQEVRRRPKEKEMKISLRTVNKGDIKKGLFILHGIEFLPARAAPKQPWPTAFSLDRPRRVATEISVKPEMIAEAVIALGEAQAVLEKVPTRSTSSIRFSFIPKVSITP